MNWLKNLAVFLLLAMVVAASFWISFVLGKRIIGPLKPLTSPKIEVEIPEPPLSIKALQEIEKIKEPPKKAIVTTPPAATVKKPITASKKPAAKPAARAAGRHYFKVQAGLFNGRQEAKELADKIKNSGFAIYLKKVGERVRVQVGAFKTKSEAESVLASLKEKGFEATVVYE